MTTDYESKRDGLIAEFIERERAPHREPRVRSALVSPAPFRRTHWGLKLVDREVAQLVGDLSDEPFGG